MAHIIRSPLVGVIWAWLDKDVQNVIGTFFHLLDLLSCISFIPISSLDMIGNAIHNLSLQRKRKIIPCISGNNLKSILSGKPSRPGKRDSLGNIKWIPFGDGLVGRLALLWNPWLSLSRITMDWLGGHPRKEDIWETKRQVCYSYNLLL